MADTPNTRDEAPRRNPPVNPAAAAYGDPALAGGVPPTAEQRKEAEEKIKQAREQAEQKARERANEFSEKMFENQQKVLNESQEEVKRQRELRQKHMDEQRKEVERRAALSADEQIEETEKLAAMTPEEIAKRDAERGQVGFVTPVQLDQINPLVSTPMFPLFNEGAHPAEMILTEANGQRSRAYAYLAPGTTVKIGQPLKQTVAPTSTTPGTFVLAAAGADCQAIAIYGGVADPTNGLRIAVLVRDCEINGYQIYWGAITVPEQAIGLATLETKGIIVRY
jgi:hypothetical protein